MQKKDKPVFSDLWRGHKIWRIFFILACLLHILLIAIAVIDYAQLKKVSGIVQDIEFDNYKRTKYVTMHIMSDANNYYQTYKRRFNDDNLLSLRKNDTVYFYTTLRAYNKRMALFAGRDSDNTKYYPILNINTQKSWVTVLLFHFYRNSLLSLLLIIFIVGALFYLIPFVATTGWRNRIIILTIAAIYLWLSY